MGSWQGKKKICVYKKRGFAIAQKLFWGILRNCKKEQLASGKQSAIPLSCFKL